ncbi:MAG: methyltransferase domain-containing protein [Candidatus Accumulibacter sp.]|jgi:SAM-dependent methyltransferase|nr:methyltransferase domain-containing protein [Accumulibacter sp.]
MAYQDCPDEYSPDACQRLAQAVPADARDVLDIACGEGRLGEALKRLSPQRRVTGIDKNREFAGLAAVRLDQVLMIDIEQDSLPFDAGRFDCIVAGDVFARYADPLDILARLRPTMRPGGHLIASLPNPQHWARIDALLRGEASPVSAAAYGVADGIRCFLDAGYLPRIVDRRFAPAPDGWLAAMRPAATRLGINPTTFAVRTQTWQYFIDARPIGNLPAATDERPVTVGACVNDSFILRENLLASLCLKSGGHETLTAEGAASAAEGFNAIVAQAKHELVVLAHQDVYLPAWWIGRLWQQYDEACRASGGKVGVMGVYGVLGTPHGILHCGCVCDRDHLLDEAPPLPACIESLDELVLIVPKNTPLRFDPALGFHLYGTDICLVAESLGLQSMAIDAPCHHNSRLGDTLPAAFEQSKAILRGKWSARLPIATPCAIVA